MWSRRGVVLFLCLGIWGFKGFLLLKFCVWGFGIFLSFCQKKHGFLSNPAAVFINTTAVAVISDAVFANAKNVCDREKICFCRK